VHRIDGDLTIPGRGEPVRCGAVVLGGPAKSSAGPSACAPATPVAPATPATQAPATQAPRAPRAPRSGLLAAGYDADVIVLDADPLADLSVPTHVRGVRWDGRGPRAE
jgi:hypothetical protein